MRQHEFLSEDDLFEINMGSKNLTKLVKDIPGALVGLEFEMIVPDAYYVDDDAESEPDYDMDERCTDIDDIVRFFCRRGEGRTMNNEDDLREALQDAYGEWLNDEMTEQWLEQDIGEMIRNYITEATSIREDAVDEYLADHADDIDVENAAEEAGDKAVEDAVEEAMENPGEGIYAEVQENWEDEWRDEDREREWLRSKGFRNMRDIENEFSNTWWPFRTTPEAGENMEEIATQFSEWVGRPVKSGSYHSINRDDQMTEGFYIMETDSSLEPNDGDTEAGLEFVSPPLPLSEMMQDIKKIAAWAEHRGAYTSKKNKTGLHMNISVPGLKERGLDYIKLVMLLGDNRVLEEFDRVNYSYARSSFNILADRAKSNPARVQEIMEKMKGHLDIAATKALHNGFTDKYTSINVKENRVEFRGPGGNYLGMFEQGPQTLFNPMMRMIVALDAACDPEKYREEYQKKFYKFLTKAVPEKKDLLELFTRYAAGKGKYSVAMPGRKIDVEATDEMQAKQKAIEAWKIAPDSKAARDILDNASVEWTGMPKSAYKSFLKQRDTERKSRTGKDSDIGDWAVFSKKTDGFGGKHMKLNGEPITFYNTTYSEAAAEFRKMCEKHNADFDGYEIRDISGETGNKDGTLNGRPSNPDGNYVLYRYDGTGIRNVVLYRFMASDVDDANNVLTQWREQYGDDPKVYAIKDPSQAWGQPDAPRAPATQEPQTGNQQRYELYRYSDGRTIQHDGQPIQFTATSPQDANSKIERIARDFNLGAPQLFAARSVLNVPPHTVTTSDGRQQYRVYDAREPDSGRTIGIFHATPATAQSQFNAYLQGISPGYRSVLDYEIDTRTPTQQPRQPAQQPAQQASYPTWEVFSVNDQNTVVRTLTNMQAPDVAATLPEIETELNLPRGSLRVRIV